MHAEIHAELKAAFPWWTDDEWTWRYSPTSLGGEPYRIRPVRQGAKGEMAIWMLGADADRYDAVKNWLVRRLDPAFHVPATGETWRMQGKSVSGGHGNTLPR